MSTPPEPAEKPTVPMARFMMDGIIHNIARKQRLKVQQSQKKHVRERSPHSPTLEEPFPQSDESPEQAMIDYFPPPAMLSPRKGILKSPTVHFPDELDIPEDQDRQPRFSSPLLLSGAMAHSLNFQTSQTLALPPPPPPVTQFPAPPPPPPADAPHPPTLFNREIEANEYLNEAAYKLYTKFIDELSEFVDQQGEVIRMRLRVQERRTELKRLRESVSQCDILLINYLRECMTGGIPSDDGTLLTLFEAAQAARDLVGPKELEYEPMEVGLGAEEHKLKVKYSNIENKFEHFFRLNATSTTKQSIPSKIEYESTDSSASRGNKKWTGLEPRDAGMLYGTLIGEQVSIGQEPLRAEDEYTEMLQGQEASEMKKQNPSSDTADLSKKHRSSATMDDKVEDNLPPDLLGIAGADELDITRSQEFETRDRRISQSLKGVASHSLFDTPDEPRSLPDDLPVDLGLREGDSLLLLDEQCDTQSIFSDYLVSFESTRDRVNRWILHQLRVSPREIYALRRRVIDCTPGFPQWAALALREWPNDMLGHGQSYHQGSIEDESDSPVEARHPSEPYPSVDPPAETFFLRETLKSTSNYTHLASAPTLSDLHNRTISSEQDVVEMNLGFQAIAAT